MLCYFGLTMTLKCHTFLCLVSVTWHLMLIFVFCYFGCGVDARFFFFTHEVSLLKNNKDH